MCVKVIAKPKVGVFWDTVYSVPAQETVKHRAMFGWLLLSDVAAVTKPRRETRWNLLGCPKLANRYQPLVGQVYHIVRICAWMRYCCLTSFSDCRYMPWLRRYSPTNLSMVPRWRFFGEFLRLVFQRAACVSDLHPKFALRPHHVRKYGRHPTCDRWD